MKRIYKKQGKRAWKQNHSIRQALLEALPKHTKNRPGRIVDVDTDFI